MHRPPDWAIVLGLLLFGLALTLPYSGPQIRETPDGLYYEAQKREIQGEGQVEARRAVFASALAQPLKDSEQDLAPEQRRVDNPEWVEYSSRFYRRRWTVPILAAALEPVFGDRALEEAALLGWALLPAALFLLMRRRFDPLPSAVASVFCAVLPPLWDFGHWPITDSWGLTLMSLGLMLALLVRSRGLAWLPAWILCVLALSFTRDLTIILVIATAWLAFRERSRVMAWVAGTGLLASIPAPLIFNAPLRDTLAYDFNDFRIPTDTSWSFIVREYPSHLGDLIRQDLEYPGSSPLPTALTVVMGIVVIASLVALILPWRTSDRFLTLIRATIVGGAITILLSVNYTGMRLELVFVPAVAAGLALLADTYLPRFRESGARARETAT
jgi:hypothetical protein